MYTLATFHFDKSKSACILKSWVKDSNLSYRQLDELTQIPYDTITNYMTGRVQDLKLEIIFKICVATGHSICEFISLMLDGIEINFADQLITEPPAAHEEITELPDAPPPPPEMPSITIHDLPESLQQIHQEHESQLNRFRAVHMHYVGQLQEYHSRSLTRYEKQIDVINAEHAKHIESMECAHEKALHLLENQVTHFRRRSWWLGGLLALETVCIIALFVVDAVTPGLGWLHGIASLFGGHDYFVLRG